MEENISINRHWNDSANRLEIFKSRRLRITQLQSQNSSSLSGPVQLPDNVFGLKHFKQAPIYSDRRGGELN